MPAIIIAAQHPLTRAVASLLVSRGEPEGVALARGLAIVEMLIAEGWIDRQEALKSVRAAKRRRAAAQDVVAFNDSGTLRLALGKEVRK